MKNLGLLESAVGRPFQSAFGEDAYPTIAEKAAALFHSLIANHPFHDGNKRTAVIAVHHFLIANGLLIALSNEETYRLAKRVASYRERGSEHQEIFGEVASALVSRTISFSQLRMVCRDDDADRYFKKILSEVVSLRQKFRRNKSNRLVSAE